MDAVSRQLLALQPLPRPCGEDGLQHAAALQLAGQLEVVKHAEDRLDDTHGKLPGSYQTEAGNLFVVYSRSVTRITFSLPRERTSRLRSIARCRRETRSLVDGQGSGLSTRTWSVSDGQAFDVMTMIIHTGLQRLTIQNIHYRT